MYNKVVSIVISIAESPDVRFLQITLLFNEINAFSSAFEKKCFFICVSFQKIALMRGRKT